MYRQRIKRLYRKTGLPTCLDDEGRVALECAIFLVENDLEHRSGSRHHVVVQLRAIRNSLLYDADVNEHPSSCRGGVRKPAWIHAQIWQKYPFLTAW